MLAAGAALVLACGEGERAPPEAAVQRLELSTVGGVEAPPTEVVAEYFATEREGWTYRGTRAYRSEDHADTMIVEGGSEQAEIGLPGDVDPARFNRLAVSLRADSAQTIHVRQGAPGDRGPVGDGIMVPKGDEPVTILLDLDEFDFDQPRYSRQVSLFLPTGRHGNLGLISVALLHEPVQNWIPAPESGATMVALEGEERDAVGLTSERALSASFQAGPGSVLSFSLGVPRISAPRTAEHRVRLTLTDARGREVAEQFVAGAEWSTIRLPLDGLAGEVALRLELDCDREGTALVGLEPPVVYRPVPGPRTVLMVTSDTHRADHLGVYAGPIEISTPNIDALAAAGTYFHDAVSSTNVTKPSHVALMTGVSPRDTGVVDNVDRLSDAPVTLAEHFRAAGWATWAAVSMTHLSDARSGLGQGFDRLFAPVLPTQDSRVTIDRVFDWLPDAEGRPLFVWLHAFDVHTPYLDRGPFTQLYYPDGRDPRSDELQPLPEWQLPKQHLDVRDLDYLRALYRGEVSYLDSQMGRLFSHGRFQDAIVAFTADHGESLTSHGEWFNHGGLYPQTLRVPLILKGPGVEAGVQSARAVQNTDLGRTLLELAGVDPQGFPGTSLLEPSRSGEPRFVLSVFGRSAAVFHGRWLFILHLERHHLADPNYAPIERHSTELYDLIADPDCLHDIDEQIRDQARKLRAALVEWLSSGHPAAGWKDLNASADADALAALQQLGYATGPSQAPDVQWFDPECDCEECRKWR